MCPLTLVAQDEGSLLPKVREHFAEFLQHSSLKRLGILYQSTCVGLGYGLMWRLFPGTPSLHGQSDKPIQHTEFVTIHWPRNINLVPIDYAFRPCLRGRLTLRRLALHRNPWTFGVSVSHTHLATHVSIRTSDTSRIPHRIPSRAYGTLRYHPEVRRPLNPQLRCVA